MRRRALAGALASLLVCAGVACRRAEKPAASAAPAAEAASGPTRYPITGIVRGIEGANLTIEHDEIEGFMGAMTMAFSVRGGSEVLPRLRQGDRVSGTLVVDGADFWIEGLASAAQARAPGSAAVAPATPRPNRGVPVGDPMPDFALTDQTGGAVRLSQLRGGPVAVTFLYTRCPIATACPMTTAKFSQLDALLAGKGFGSLLTITVDPEHDTPAVLADYAKKAGADPKRWKFLTGDPRAVADVAERFGVLYYPDKGQIVHAQAVAVVDADGRLANIYYGEEWKPEEILRDMEKARKG